MHVRGEGDFSTVLQLDAERIGMGITNPLIYTDTVKAIYEIMTSNVVEEFNAVVTMIAIVEGVHLRIYTYNITKNAGYNV